MGLAEFSKSYRKLGRGNPFLYYGLPMISITVLSSVALGRFIQGRHDVNKIREQRHWEVTAATKLLSPEGPLKDIHKNTPVDLNDELKKVQELVKVDFEYRKVPRPPGEY